MSLEACLTRALEKHPAIQAAGQEVAAAKARLRRAGTFEAPSVSLEGSKLGTPVSRTEHDASLRLSQELGAPGARGRAKDVARLDVSIAEASLQSVALGVRGAVMRSYRRLQADEQNARVLESLRRTAADLEQMVNSRLRTGGARYLDVLRARSERVRLENDVIEAGRAIREDRRSLNTLMARAPDELLEVADTLAYEPMAETLDSVLSRAMQTRPRLLAARLEVQRGGAQLAVARHALWPSASIAAGLDRIPGYERPGLGGEVSLSLPFVPWAERQALVDEARSTSGGAQARLEAAEREVESAVRSAFESAQGAERQVQQFRRVLLSDANDAIRTAIQNYQAGQIDGLELFETLRTFRSIELEHIRALLNYGLAQTDLAVAE